MLIQASIKVLPNSFKGREQNYELVDEALKIINKSNLKNLIGPSETTVEGLQGEVMELIKSIQDYYYKEGIDFSLFVNFEYNKDNFYFVQKEKNINNINKV